jgi:membrane fusion protein (multidrug efflux system)
MTKQQWVAKTVQTAAPILTVAFAMAGAGCGSEANGQGAGRGPGGPERSEPAISVEIAEVAREPISSLYSTSATLRADREATVIARTRGVVERLVVEEGDRVRMGTPLAYLEDDEQVIAAARARTAEETARRDHERLSGLYDRGLVSVDEYEASRRDADDARHALDLAELELSRTVIRAPVAGVIVTRHLDVGDAVSDGTSVYDLADVDPLYADVTIPERHVTRLRAGQQVRLTADATAAQATAVIERIAPAVDPATGTVKVTVAVQDEANLRPGAFVRVDIVTDTRSEALVVPRTALVAEGRRWHLYRLTADNETVEQIEVELGFESGDRIELAKTISESAAVSQGDRVVVLGAPALSDGAKVRIPGTEEPEGPVRPESGSEAG